MNNNATAVVGEDGDMDDQPIIEVQQMPIEDDQDDEKNLYDEYNFNHFENQHGSVMSTMSKVSGSVINREDPHIRAALELNHRFVDKNIHETLNRLK